MNVFWYYVTKLVYGISFISYSTIGYNHVQLCCEIYYDAN